MFSMSYAKLLNLHQQQESPLSWVEQRTRRRTPEASSH